jgi:hypothetical protein
MSVKLYLVLTNKGNDYGSINHSTAFSTLDIDEAMNFARDYYFKNLELVLFVEGYDSFEVNVESNIIGKENTSSLLWSTNQYRLANLSKIDDFGIDLRTSLIKRNELYIAKSIIKKPEINATIADIFNNTAPETQVSPMNDYVHFLNSYFVEQVDLAIKYKKPIHLVDDSLHDEEIIESIDDSLDWELYYSFEEKYLRA